MFSSSLPKLELRHYEYFSVLAKELHFGRAAEQLGISQPALSQQLRWIEQRIGAPLLERNRRRVQLTEVGDVLRIQSKAVLEQVERAQLATAQAAGGNAGRLSLTYVASASLSGVMPRLVYLFRQANPAVQLQLQEQDMQEQVAAIARSAVDVGFIRPPLPDMPEGISTFELLVEPMHAALHVSHGSARKGKLDLTDLAKDTFVCTHRRDGVGFYGITKALCQRAGFTPRTEVLSSQTTILISMVAAGFGVALVPASARSFSPPDVVFVPLSANSVKSSLAIAFAHGNRSPAMRAFVQIARTWAQGNQA